MASRLIPALLAGANLLAQQSSTDEAVFQKVCGSCHSYKLISDLKSTPEWEDTVDSMIDRGAKAGPAERAAVLRYLRGNYTRININTASAGEIAEVLGIPEAAAEKLVAHRPYKSLDGVIRVDAAPAAKLTSLRDHIAFR